MAAHGREKRESTLWNGYSLTANKLARCWLLLAPNDEEEFSHFQKIVSAKTNVLYLTNHTDSSDKYYFKSVPELPEYIINDTILKEYFDCDAGSHVGDIIHAYKEENDEIFLGQVDLPQVYSFAAPESKYFHFKPAFPNLKSEFSKYDIMSFSNYDFYWETNTWNAYTSEGKFLVSLILPNYEVDTRIKFLNVLNELICLPPDHNKIFPGGSLYRSASERFNSNKTKSETSTRS